MDLLGIVTVPGHQCFLSWVLSCGVGHLTPEGEMRLSRRKVETNFLRDRVEIICGSHLLKKRSEQLMMKVVGLELTAPKELHSCVR